VKPPEITFIVTYACPRCQTLLEAKGRETSIWQRCPKCGRPNLPPEHNLVPLEERPPLEGDVLILGPEPDSPALQTAAPAQTGAYSGALRRIVLTVGFLTSLTLLLYAFFDQNAFNVVAFGIVTIILLAFLILGARQRRH